MHKGLQDFLAHEKKMKPASELQEHKQNESNDMEWNAFGEEEMQEPFEDYRFIFFISFGAFKKNENSLFHRNLFL